MWQNGNEKPCVNSQQSTYQSTHFFSTTKIFGRNTPFSAHLRNCLTFSALHSKTNISHPSFHLTPCERWPFAPRNMPDRTAKHARSHRQTCPIEPRLGVLGNSKHARWQNQRAVSTMKWGKNGGFIRWFIKNPEPTFLPKYPTNQGFHPNPTSISYTLLT